MPFISYCKNLHIRNLPQSRSENIDSKVNGLIRDGLKLGNIKVGSAERKAPHEGSDKPGVVVATLKTTEDKKSVMMAKNKLKNNRQYSTVYINHDQTKNERLLADNFRAILSAVKNGDTNLSLRGARVVRNGSSTHRGDRDIQESSPRSAARDSERRGGRNSNSSSPSRSRDYGSQRDRSRELTGRDKRRSHQRDSRR